MRSDRGRLASRALLLALSSLVGSCKQPTVEIDARVTWGGASRPESCSGTMNTFVVEVFEIPAHHDLPQGDDRCVKCVEPGGGCVFLERHCVCGSEEPADPLQFIQLFNGELFVIPLDHPDADHCFRLVALAVPGGGQTGERRSCACEPSWTGPDGLGSLATICALSEPWSSARTEIEMTGVNCPGVPSALLWPTCLSYPE